MTILRTIILPFKSTALIILIGHLFISSIVFAFTSEPDGFGGIKWGTAISEMSDMVFEGELKGNKLFTRKSDVLKINDVPVDKIQYCFNHERKLFVVGIEFHNIEHFRALRESMFKKYDKILASYKHQYIWGGDIARIKLAYDERRISELYHTLISLFLKDLK